MGAMSSNESDTTEFDLQRLRRHQPDAVKRWFLQHADAVYTFVYYRANRDADLAADLVQETFLEALARIDDYDPGRGGMLTWLTLLSRNCIHRALRQQDRYRTTERMWEKINARLLTAYRQLESTPLPDEIVERQETAELVQMALANLPDNYRQALTQHYYEQRSLQEIASSRGTTEGAIKSLLHRARLAFRAAFGTIADSLQELPSGPQVRS
jgi:RNA polymerase sigma-70 factor (ECF subfamily)